MLRQLQLAASEPEVRRFMEGEDQLLRDFISLGTQAEYERQRAEHEKAEKERERQRAEHERAERERAEQALSRSIRHLHALGQEADAIAAALSIDADKVRRVLADADGGQDSA